MYIYGDLQKYTFFDKLCVNFESSYKTCVCSHILTYF